jgi:hypothetical protein
MKTATIYQGFYTEFRDFRSDPFDGTTATPQRRALHQRGTVWHLYRDGNRLGLVYSADAAIRWVALGTIPSEIYG